MIRYQEISKLINAVMEREVRLELGCGEYAFLLLVFIVGSVLGIVLVMVVTLLTQKEPEKEKNSAFECGFSPFSQARGEFYVKYFLISIIFLVFDIEIIYFIPWITTIQMGGLFGYIVFLLVTKILVIGFYYEWKKGVVDR